MTKICQFYKDLLHCSIVSRKKNDNFVAKWSYFYRHGRTVASRVEIVKKTVPTAQIVDSGDHFHGFVGGAASGSANDSYMWVEFKA